MQITITTITNSHAPIAARVPLPLPHSLTVAEYAIPFFRIVEFDETNSTLLQAAHDELVEWSTPDGALDDQYLDDFITTRRLLLKYLSPPRPPPSPDYKIVMISNNRGVQCLMTYTPIDASNLLLTHLISTHAYRGSGTAAMNHLIDKAIQSPTPITTIQLCWLTSSQTFYQKFGFKVDTHSPTMMIKDIK